jgi:hypothetical protein
VHAVSVEHLPPPPALNTSPLNLSQCCRVGLTFGALQCIFWLLEVGGRHLGDVYQVPLSNTCRHNPRTQCRSTSVPALYALMPTTKCGISAAESVAAAQRRRSRAYTLARGLMPEGNACGGLRARCACLGVPRLARPRRVEAGGGGASSAGSTRHKPCMQRGADRGGRLSVHGRRRSPHRTPCAHSAAEPPRLTCCCPAVLPSTAATSLHEKQAKLRMSSLLLFSQKFACPNPGMVLIANPDADKA